jgi:hypothetical protein
LSPEAPVRRQLDAYNARDLEGFIAQYSEEIRIFRPPAPEPVIAGKAALAAYYATNRFNLPDLHADVVNRMILGNKVVDHELIAGVREGTFEVVAVYEVIDGRISSVWFFSSGE